MKKITGVLLIAVLLLAVGCFHPRLPQASPSQTTPDPTAAQESTTAPVSDLQQQEIPLLPSATVQVDPIRTTIDAMTLDEKIGQLVIVGVEGFTITDHVKELIRDNKVSGCILYAHNIQDADQLLTLLHSLKAMNTGNPVPLFISVDQEGGKVDRMTQIWENMPSNRVIGERNDPDLCYRIGHVLAEEIKAFGFNLNFAPVLDVNSNPQNPVIGDRAFGKSADIVSRLGIPTMKGIQADGIIPVVKHFPGHGDTSVDSHYGLPVVLHGMDRLERVELVPFQKAVDEGADAVMVAHILLPNIDPMYPASLSKTMITSVLRGKMHFSGVIITDDLTMGAIVQKGDIGESAVTSFLAGSDILLVAYDYDKQLSVIHSLKKAVEDHRITTERLDESIYRILELKYRYHVTDIPVSKVDTKPIDQEIQSILTHFQSDKTPAE